MDKILILLKKETITLYDVVDGKAAAHTVRGEEVTDAEDYELVAESLRENYNDDELADLSVDVVYTACDTEMIKSFTEELLPCGGWQVFEFKKILPEILLKNGKLKPDTTAEVSFDGDAYKVSMTKDGTVKLSSTETGKTINDNDITAIYREKYNVFTDEAKLKKYEVEIKQLKKENEELSKFVLKSDKLEKENKKLKSSVKTGNELKEELLGLLRCPVYGSKSGKLEWLVEEATVVKDSDVIAANVSRSWTCRAGSDGVLWYVKEDGENMHDNEVIGVIAHEFDPKKNAIKWLETLQYEEAEEEETIDKTNYTKKNSIFTNPWYGKSDC